MLKQMWFAILASAVALQTAPGVAVANPAVAQRLAVGMTVRDTTGAAVGTIEQVSGDAAIVSTGQQKVSLPVSSFAIDAKGPLIAMSRAELNAAAEKAAAQSAAALRAMLLPGVLVKGSGGLNIGTIKQVEGDFVILTSPKGDAKIPVGAFKRDSAGIVIGMTAADFEAAVARP